MFTCFLHRWVPQILHQQQALAGIRTEIGPAPKWSMSLGALLLLGLSGSAAPAIAEEPDSILVGVAGTLTRDVPTATLLATRPAVDSFMESSSGLPVTILVPQPSHELAARLADDRVQLGVFPGVEFAWERAKHPELRPLAILINQERDRQAVLVVRADNHAIGFCNLKEGKLALPKRSPEHCRRFLEASCRTMGQGVEEAFPQITEPATVEDALDDLIDGIIATAVVDRAGLKAYARRKPGRFGKLKLLVSSVRFPDPVIAYRAGALDEALIQRLHRGLSQADKTPEGRNILTLWMATAFEIPTAEYDKLLVEILKTNPNPGAVAQR
jgi:ABC transporter, phosphonate, periplasmic substrate-binding protein